MSALFDRYGPGFILPEPNADPEEINKKISRIRQLCGSSNEMRDMVDKYLLETVSRHIDSINKAKKAQEKLREIHKKLTSPPWFPGTFIRTVETPEGIRYLVAQGSTRRLVEASPEILTTEFMRGEDVFLGQELNVILARSGEPISLTGEIAPFERYVSNGRMILKHRDEEVIVETSSFLHNVKLNRGDLIRWDRNLKMAFEKIEKAEESHYFLDEIPDIGRDKVGGQEENLDKLISILAITLNASDLARQYDITGRQSILMHGPSGCGKTLMARVATSEISRMTGKKCRFAVVKPGEWKSMWYGASGRNAREFFRMMKERAKDNLVVVFLDEVDSIGRIRGDSTSRPDDDLQNVLLTELDGFSDRSNIAVICATNRKDLLDPAFLQRISDLEIFVGPPDKEAAWEIFNIHLPPELPFQSNGKPANIVREEMITSAVSRIYTPNADNMVCTLKLRNGEVRKIHARDLASGRLFEQVCRNARQSALIRQMRGGKALGYSDMSMAVAEFIDKLRTTLTPRNAHTYIQDLPQDMDVVAVEPVRRRVSNPSYYINAA